MGETTEEPPRKRGRPAKPESEKTTQKVTTTNSSEPKRGRGRPKGSKNKARKIAAKSKTGSKRGAKPKEEAQETE